MMDDTYTYFVTWTTYGTWVPGDRRGWRKRGQWEQVSRPLLERWCREQMKGETVLLSPTDRETVENACREHCQFRHWELLAVNARSNHVHVVVITAEGPKKVQDQLKANCTRCLRQQSTPLIAERTWTRGGDIEILDTDDEIEVAVIYVTEAQDRKGVEGEPTALAAGSIGDTNRKAPDASAFGSQKTPVKRIRRLNLFTVGHSNRSDAEFVELLRRHGVTAVADVRSQPYSRHLPHFNREPLKELLSASEISYVFMGEELGARRSETECYVDGQAKYELIAQTPAFHAGLERIRTGVSQHVVALMCAEKDPMTCHRAILVAKALRNDLDIRHIVSDEELEAHDELEQRLLRRWNLDGQNLFLTTDELLQEAYEKQAAEIAFVKKEMAPTNHKGASDD
jgi:REP element-mobilizing transposase RayT